ncbi:hypothetical protein OSJ57_14735 [Sphingomonas sp. HH69]
MPAAEKSYHLDVSAYYFRLTSESIRLYSNLDYKHVTFSDVVNSRSETVDQIAIRYTSDDMKEHLRIIPTDGDKVLEFTILKTSADNIDDAVIMLEEALGSSVKFADALSLMLYDFVVEANSTEVLTKLGISADEARNYRKILKSNKSAA